jgi:hypothetical protein
MITLNFSILIKASKETVWKILWEDKTYREWTSVFMEGSYAVSDWQEGSKILFLSPSGEGMFSTIEKKVPGELMSFRHLGIVKDGQEQPGDEQTKEWSGARETYILKEIEGVNELSVSVDVTEKQEPYFTDVFPQALEKVKSLCENQWNN